MTPEAETKHNINITMFDDMVECIEFKCGDKVFRTIVGDGNRKGDCPVCGRDFTTYGGGLNHVIAGTPMTTCLSESPTEAKE